jgi:hypothetical protein
MSKLSACFVVGMLALAACGDDPAATADASIDAKSIDAKVFMDAPPPVFDWSCSSNTTPPTTTAAMITLSGTVQGVTVSGFSPTVAAVSGATVTACVNGAANCTMTANKDGSDTSDTQGAWSIGPFTTGGTPQDDFIQMTATNYRTTYTYPSAPFVADQANIPALTFSTSSDTNTGLGILGCNTALAIVGLAAVDCAGAPITDSANVMISIKQGGNAVNGTTVIDAGTLNAMAAGTFLVCGVPANPTTEVSATYMGHQLLAHNVKTVAGDITATILVPGY